MIFGLTRGFWVLGFVSLGGLEVTRPGTTWVPAWYLSRASTGEPTRKDWPRAAGMTVAKLSTHTPGVHGVVITETHHVHSTRHST